jgi:PEP-CTERM motif
MRRSLLAVALSILGCATANATVSMSYHGEVDPATAPSYSQPVSVNTTGLAQMQIGSPGTLPGNPGWDPYGTGDTTHPWWNIYSGSVTFNLSGDELNLVWGSPNYDSATDANYVMFYSASNGTGAPLGTVLASDLYSDFGSPPIDNDNHPGYLISIATSANFGSVVIGTDDGASDFEFAVAGTPEPSTWAMLFLGFGGLGFAAFRRSRQAVALSL